MRLKLDFCLFIFLFFGSSIAFAHGWKAPSEAASIQNPVAFSETSRENGREIFMDACAVCHGDNLRGISKEETGLAMDTPNLITRLKGHSEGDFFWKIQNGKGEMPSFKDDLAESEIWDIINFIKGYEAL